MYKRAFYDLETDSEHPQYANMTLVGILLEEIDADGLKKTEVITWEAPWTDDKLNGIRKVLCADNIDERVGFNCLNFDNLVLANYGIKVPEKNTHDAMLAIKTCFPGIPSFALKFLCWLKLGDPHWAEFELNQTGHRFGEQTTDELRAYHRHDLVQHRDIWDWVCPTVQLEKHWESYQLDMRMGDPLEEMTYQGGVLVDTKKARKTLNEILIREKEIQRLAQVHSKGEIKNINSAKQVAKHLVEVENLELEFTATGEFQVKKKDLADIIGMEEEDLRKWFPGMEAPFSIIAMLAWQYRDLETVRKYVHNYLEAAEKTECNDWIPAAYNISAAGTRRTLSKSFYKINFQNSTEEIDKFKLIPPGYLGWFIDSTQIENVVHIYESKDHLRRAAYEADVDWNEYVWLCNRILGSTKTKKELDSIKSKQVPHWTVYKLYKTIKLAINFGMGVAKFCKSLGLDLKIGRKLFEDIHQACPAIRNLNNRIEGDLETFGFVQDVFGHIYTAPQSEAYKLVAFLIQGCGTGSLPKAQIRANYDTLHRWSADMGTNVGPLMATTHDENGGLLRLDLGEEVIHSILQEVMMNMTTKFSSKFDNIPLRAKLYLTTTNWYDRKQHEQPNWKQGITIPR